MQAQPKPPVGLPLATQWLRNRAVVTVAAAAVSAGAAAIAYAHARAERLQLGALRGHAAATAPSTAPARRLHATELALEHKLSRDGAVSTPVDGLGRALWPKLCCLPTSLGDEGGRVEERRGTRRGRKQQT